VADNSLVDELDGAVDALVEARHQQTLASFGSEAEYDAACSHAHAARTRYCDVLTRLRATFDRPLAMSRAG
jgi:hypothetical protein